MGTRNGRLTDQALDLGPCCCCEGTTQVRNLLALPRRAPVPGTGWGCLFCGLAPDGAQAVICDDCLESDRPLRFVCQGYPLERQRAPVEQCGAAFEHDLRYHPEELAQRN